MKQFILERKQAKARLSLGLNVEVLWSSGNNEKTDIVMEEVKVYKGSGESHFFIKYEEGMLTKIFMFSEWSKID